MAETRKSRQKAAKKKRKRARAQAPAPTLGTRALLRTAGSLPIQEVLMTRDWRPETSLVQILVARRAPRGEIVASVFLIDLACLGVKNAMVNVFPDLASYRQGPRRQILSGDPLAPTSLDLAAKVIQEGIAYAEELGFHAHPDFESARRLLLGADPDVVEEPIPVGGPDGKPFFVAGPRDDAKRIVEHLTRRLGADGFDFLVPLH